MTFTPNIPQSTQSLGQTRDLIKNNFSNYNALVSVDHVAPNAAGQGQHQQVTFNAIHEPSVFPVTPPIAFTNTSDGYGNVLPGGLAQLFYYSGVAAVSKEQYKMNASGVNKGSVLLFGGIILKWGRAAYTENTGISFATETGANFPTNCYTVNVTAVNTATNSGPVTAYAHTISNLGFTPRMLDNAGNPTSGTISWIAIGN